MILKMNSSKYIRYFNRKDEHDHRESAKPCTARSVTIDEMRLKIYIQDRNGPTTSYLGMAVDEAIWPAISVLVKHLELYGHRSPIYILVDMANDMIMVQTFDGIASEWRSLITNAGMHSHDIYELIFTLLNMEVLNLMMQQLSMSIVSVSKCEIKNLCGIIIYTSHSSSATKSIFGMVDNPYPILMAEPSEDAPLKAIGTPQRSNILKAPMATIAHARTERWIGNLRSEAIKGKEPPHEMMIPLSDATDRIINESYNAVDTLYESDIANIETDGHERPGTPMPGAISFFADPCASPCSVISSDRSVYIDLPIEPTAGTFSSDFNNV